VSVELVTLLLVFVCVGLLACKILSGTPIPDVNRAMDKCLTTLQEQTKNHTR